MPSGDVGSSHRKYFCSTKIGPLQRQLQKGEYGFFRSSPVFESDFVQISKHGDPIEVIHEEHITTVGISFTNPGLPVPDVLLVARPIYLSEDPTLPHDTKFDPKRKVKYELSRLFPLCLVKISIHDTEKQQLRVKLVSGSTFYLQLCPESFGQEYLFDSWTRIIKLLWPPSNTTSKMKEKAIKSSCLRSSLPPRPKTPSPATSESGPNVTKSRMGKKRKKKANKAKPPVSQSKSPPPNAEQEAKLASPPPLQAREVTEVLEEKLAERIPTCRSPAGEKERHESSRPTSRRFIEDRYSSQIRSERRGATRKPSKLLFLIRSCAWGNPRKKIQGVKSKEKNQPAE